MKKRFIILGLLFSFITQPVALCAGNQSTDTFSVNLSPADIPAPVSDPPKSSGSSGLSGGAITAITLGSIGGVAVLGGLAWLLKPYWGQGMVSGAAIGIDCPVLPVTLDDAAVNTILAKNPCYGYLAKSFQISPISESTSARYLMIPDTAINPDTFNSVLFRIPTEVKNSQGLINVKITQISDSITSNEFEAKLYTNASNKELGSINKGKEVRFEKTISRENEGIVQKSGVINYADLKDDDTGALIISYKKNPLSKEVLPTKKYAYLIEFKG